jgi:hypothetical protein
MCRLWRELLWVVVARVDWKSIGQCDDTTLKKLSNYSHLMKFAELYQWDASSTEWKDVRILEHILCMQKSSSRGKWRKIITWEERWRPLSVTSEWTSTFWCINTTISEVWNQMTHLADWYKTKQFPYLERPQHSKSLLDSPPKSATLDEIRMMKYPVHFISHGGICQLWAGVKAIWSATRLCQQVLTYARRFSQ